MLNSIENKDNEVIISDYDFEFGNITDENVKRPDIINFKELESETEKWYHYWIIYNDSS